MEKFNERLKQLRTAKGLSQKELASLLGLTTSAIGNYEIGLREPSIEIIKNLCKFFDVSSDYLLGLSDF